MRADRLLSLLWILKVGQSIPAAELAARLEVSTRTILRDVEALSAAGVPVYCERGRGGGVTLLSDCKKDIRGLSEAESQALLVSVAPYGARELGLDRELSSARQKITEALPEAKRRAAVELSQRILIDPGGWLPTGGTPHLGRLQEALLTDHRVRLRYQGRGHRAPVLRTVDPYGLVNSAGIWYLACCKHGDIRFYSVSRMTSVTVLDVVFERPNGIDLPALWERARSEFRASFCPVDVRLRVRATRLGELWGSVVPVPGAVWPELPRPEQSGGAEEGENLADAVPCPGDPASSWVTLHLRFADVTHATAVLPSLGADAKVLDPPQVRNAIVEAAKATLAAYA